MAGREYRSILIIRLSAIGDIVMASPLIRLLRVRFPGARLSWLVQPEGKALLDADGMLDEVLVWPRNDWRRLWRERRWWRLWQEVRGFRRELRARRFDLVLDVQGLLKSGWCAWLTGAQERIGLGSKEGSGWFMTRVVQKPRGETRIGSEYRHLAHALGLDARQFSMRIALTPEDERDARDRVGRAGVSGGYAVFCPFTTRAQKHWSADAWVDLARRLSAELGLRAFVLGGPNDRAAANDITSRAGATTIDVVGQTTLRQAAALIRGARLLVGVDTGLTHMGTAFGIPTLALFGSTCPYRETDSPHTVVLYKQLPCSPCYRNPTCGGAFTCMMSISVDDVVAAARPLLRAKP